ncbi:unnamed protein product [Enterobius vermicularis]|uniref:FIP-RBD domain-containing protein n=1 Tax=Enterobius vermicularis TaxID=51028 RepID=A0A0N4VF72_ENTVE|nr:unnamed protein product [Enterobius vermicularis]
MDQVGKEDNLLQMQYVFALRKSDGEIKNFHEHINTVELEKKHLEEEVNILKWQNDVLSRKAGASSSSAGRSEILEEENRVLNERVNILEAEVRRLKDSVLSKARQVAAKEAWIQTIENVNIDFQKEIEQLQCHLIEQNNRIVRLSADKETLEQELSFGKAAALTRADEAVSFNTEKIELQSDEAKYEYGSENTGHGLSAFYPPQQQTPDSESNFMSYRVRMLSAELEKTRRKVEELNRNIAISTLNGFDKPLKLQDIFDYMTAIRRDTAGLEKELQKAINQYDDLLATLKKTIDSVLPKGDRIIMAL